MTPFQKDACRCSTEHGAARSTADNLLGDIPSLLQQIGIREIAPAFDLPVIPEGEHFPLPALVEFLENYYTRILLPMELPAIVEACGRVSRGETRELISFDQQLANETRLAPFASASRQIGAQQLRRLKPLRDQRTVQRYLAAVESGQANGWHTLVYGLTLAVYSFPMRQGLLHYARETVAGLAFAAAGPKQFFDPACQDAVGKILSGIPEEVERVIPTANGEIALKLR